MTRRAETRPLRDVTSASLAEGRGGVLGPDTTRRARWWEITLECGHWTERSVKYGPRPADDRRRPYGARALSDVLPAPIRVRCDECARKAREETR